MDMSAIEDQKARAKAWFERLRVSGPGQRDPLFPWLEATASLPQMQWFIEQEVAGEAGFDDLLALTQVKMPQQAKLEMARNYWDEMGRGGAKGMHGPMLERLARHLDVRAEAFVEHGIIEDQVRLRIELDQRLNLLEQQAG